MSYLELKVPPDVLWMVTAGLMWGASAIMPRLDVSLPLRVGAAAVPLAAGSALIIGARVALNRSATTWHPSEPERTTALVTDGVFRLSRNPTYLGMLLVLAGWALALASPVALVGLAGFAQYVARFQIMPEERALTALLGEDYRVYAGRVRRWL